jgi:hypothetical protein
MDDQSAVHAVHAGDAEESKANESYCPACFEEHPRRICAELTRGDD